MIPTQRAKSWRDVAALLAGALGWEKSLSVVDEAVRELKLDRESLSEADVSNVLSTLVEKPGLLGATARLLTTRRVSRPSAALPAIRSAVTTPRPVINSVTRGELVGLLSPTLGAHKAEEVLSGVCASLGLESESFSAETALLVFERLAAEEGLIGVTARFAKARLALLFPSSR